MAGTRENCGDSGRGHRRLRPACRRGRGSHTLARLRGLRSDILIDPAIDARITGASSSAPATAKPNRVPQRGGRGALRHRGAERPRPSATPA